MRKILSSRYGLWVILVLIVAIAGFALLTRDDAATSKKNKAKPAIVESVDGTELKRLTLTQKAAERIGIQTVLTVDDAGRKIVPYSSVIYDPSGATWVYTSPEPLKFIRAKIVVERINGDQAVLAEGPAAGTQVVSVGAIELYGTEFEVGH